MGLFDWLFGQFIDVIEWTDESTDTMVYRFNRYGNEIKNGAKLIVRESQTAVFVNEGEIADILGPGTYSLETKNLPILSSLQHWDHGFNSPFKAEVYFVNTKRFVDLKWGTKNPIMLRDTEFDMVRLRAFGTYEIRIMDPKRFMQEIVGTDGHFTTSEIEASLTNLILAKLPLVLGENRISVLDLAAHYETLGGFIASKITPYFEEYGLTLTKLLIENISLPQDVEKALDKRTSREISGDLEKYLQYSTGEALSNPNGGGAADMVGMGAGMAMANKMANSFDKKPSDLGEELYYVAIDNKAQGPYDKGMLKKLIKDGVLGGEMLVWQEGMEQWQPASVILSNLFKSSPPPLP